MVTTIRTGIAVSLALMFCGLPCAFAELSIVGTDTAGNRLIYDSDLNITWYDAPPIERNWQNAMDWAASLTVGGTEAGSWRLPASLNPDGSGPCERYNCTTSEMGHLYYVELGHLGYRAPDGTYPQPGWGGDDIGPFVNLVTGDRADYWSSTLWAPIHNYQWYFEFRGGDQVAGPDFLYRDFKALAVYEGKIGTAPVPIPAALLLFGPSLIGLIVIKKKIGG